MRSLFTLLLITLAFWAFAQTRTYPAEGVVTHSKGGYTSKSFSRSFYKLEGPSIKIQPQLTVDSLHAAIGYLDVRNGIVQLFSNSHPKDANDVVAVLGKNSLIEICNIEHRATYEVLYNGDYTYEVWYTILLNGKQYYMDIKPNKLDFQIAYPEKKQRFTLFNQDTGYDGNFDVGYPEFFQVLVFDESASPMKLMFDSGMLDFKNGNEFWSSDHEGDLKTTITSKGLEFQLVGFEKDYQATWNGKALVDVKVVDIE